MKKLLLSLRFMGGIIVREDHPESPDTETKETNLLGCENENDGCAEI